MMLVSGWLVVSNQAHTYAAILCTYNSEETVLAALESILNQSLTEDKNNGYISDFRIRRNYLISE